jgi:murein L,D-transpeptidase YcbB/YkuD
MQIKQTMKKLCLGIGTSIILFTTQSTALQASASFDDESATLMMNSLQALPKKSFLRTLYTELFFVPIWVQEKKASSLSEELFARIFSDKTLSDFSRLKKDATALEQELNALYTSETALKKKIDLEFKISQLYKGYADYTLYGSINWGAFQDRLYNLQVDEIRAAWITYKPKYDPISLAVSAAMGGSIEQVFQDAEPKEYHYVELKKALNHYVALQKEGAWTALTGKGLLKPNETSALVPLLRDRLQMSGDYEHCDTPESTLYDACLKKAVVRFQKRHGLVAKGIVGNGTRGALNVPLKTRINQIRLNLDRIKWLHERGKQRHVIINIPSFTLSFEENKKLRQRMRVITGKKKNPTPIFSNTVKTIVLNPYWNIPKSIIQKEMIPKLLKNPNALTKKGIEIRKGWAKNAPLVKPDTVDWSQYMYSKTVPYRFAQVPGKRNALGKIKFLFPNEFAVYMHDTPNKGLFSRNVRAFSHGCIRLHKPRELLKTFSTFNTTVDFDKSQKILKGKEKTFFSLKQQVPVDVTYLTAYVDYDGILQFRNDIYGYDRMQLQSYRRW